MMHNTNATTVLQYGSVIVAGIIFLMVYVLGEKNLTSLDRNPGNAYRIATSEAPSELELIGVMQNAQGRQRALIRTGLNEQGAWVAVGDVIQGWQLRTIAGEKAVLEKEGLVEELRLSLRKQPIGLDAENEDGAQ